MIDCKIRQAMPGLVDSILDSVRKTEKTKIIETHMLPSRQNIIKITQDLIGIIYPGYFTENLCDSNLTYYIGSTVDRLFHHMTSEIAKAYSGNGGANLSAAERRERAIDTTIEFFRRMPQIRELMEHDVQAAFDGDPAAKGFGEIIIAYPGFEAITVQRLAHELLVLEVPLIPRIMTEWAHHQTGIDIHPGATIGKSFFIDHGTGVVIGETTEIGDNVKVYQGVTLGALSFPKDEGGNLIRGHKRHPTIENNVTIYANATILGGETVIGEGSVIGGNVWVTESIPPHTKVVIEKPQQKFITKKTS